MYAHYALIAALQSDDPAFVASLSKIAKTCKRRAQYLREDANRIMKENGKTKAARSGRRRYKDLAAHYRNEANLFEIEAAVFKRAAKLARGKLK